MTLSRSSELTNLPPFNFIRSAGGQGAGSGSESTSALRFPSNVSGSTASAYGVLEFSNPHSNGFPLWGESGNGATAVWRVRPRQQTGYYAWFWWGPGDGTWQSSDGYWGAHPYPSTVPRDQGTAHWWEAATQGKDIINAAGDDAASGTGTTVTKDVWYRQGITVTRQSANQKTIKYYFNLPNVDSSNYCLATADGVNYGESNPPSPKVVLGNSPWVNGSSEERGSHDLLGIKVFKQALSEADMLAEAADFSGIKTSAGSTHIWWGRNGFPTVDSVLCSYGTGRSFTRNDASSILSVVAV